MLIDFSVENFRSFGDEQTLCMIASNKLREHAEHLISIRDTGKSALRAGVVYGANAAGKSNLVRAMEFAKSMVAGNASLKRLAVNQFRFGESNRPTSFGFRFLVNHRVFNYGFSANAESVVEEWLDATSDSGRDDVEVFSRDANGLNLGGLHLFKDIEGEKSLAALSALKQLGARHDQLLLNKIVDLDPGHRGQLLHCAAWWFQDCLAVVQPQSQFGALIEFLDEDARFREFAGAFLANVGTGVSDFHVNRANISVDLLPKMMQGQLDEEPPFGSPGMSLQLNPEDPKQVIRRNLYADHRIRDSLFSLPFSDESDGTQRCLNLLPALYRLKNRCSVFVVDEIDRSLHPLLCHAILKFFIESCPGACQQMIVTTHETYLLDLELLRRDEIWFVEKDNAQQSKLYSLSDLKVRNDVRIEKGYLHGRFGGIPFIGDQERLKDLIECPTGLEQDATQTAS